MKNTSNWNYKIGSIADWGDRWTKPLSDVRFYQPSEQETLLRKKNIKIRPVNLENMGDFRFSTAVDFKNWYYIQELSTQNDIVFNYANIIKPTIVSDSKIYANVLIFMNLTINTEKRFHEDYEGVDDHQVGYPTTDTRTPAIVEFHKPRIMGNFHKSGNWVVHAKHAIANWRIKNSNGGIKPGRADGPMRISLDNYREFYNNGELQSIEWDKMYVQWSIKHSANRNIESFVKENITGPVNPLSNTFFVNSADDLIFTQGKHIKQFDL